MLTRIIMLHYRTISVVLLISLITVTEAFEIRSIIYDELWSWFQWLKFSFWFGVIGTTFGSIYATVEAVHLLSMAVLGGSVLTSDLRLLEILFTDTPSETIVKGAHRCFRGALALSILTGIFCLCAVADKVYDMPVFWVKMLALVAGSCFAFFIKQPLLCSRAHNEINPWTLRFIAMASLLVWFTVAATGRWIGFS